MKNSTASFEMQNNFICFKMPQWTTCVWTGLRVSWILLQLPPHWGTSQNHEGTSSGPPHRVPAAHSSSGRSGASQCYRHFATDQHPHCSTPQITCQSCCILRPQRAGLPTPQCQSSCGVCTWTVQGATCWSEGRRPQQCAGRSPCDRCHQPRRGKGNTY